MEETHHFVGNLEVGSDYRISRRITLEHQLLRTTWSDNRLGVLFVKPQMWECYGYGVYPFVPMRPTRGWSLQNEASNNSYVGANIFSSFGLWRVYDTWNITHKPKFLELFGPIHAFYGFTVLMFIHLLGNHWIHGVTLNQNHWAPGSPGSDTFEDGGCLR